MKTKLILLALLTFGLFASLIAQPKQDRGMRPPEFKPEKALMDLRQKLSLNEEQTAEVKSILFNTEKEILKLREKNVDAQMKAMEEHKKIMDSAAEKISNVLDDNQKEVFEKIRKDRKELPPPPPRH